MTAGSRLAALIAEHEPGVVGCECGQRWGTTHWDLTAWSAHVAEVIASADGLAVIELPVDFTPWQVASSGEITAPALSTGVYRPDLLRRNAAKELAAARAAEAVDRG